MYRGAGTGDTFASNVRILGEYSSAESADATSRSRSHLGLGIGYHGQF